jgi:hypothetical protein
MELVPIQIKGFTTFKTHYIYKPIKESQKPNTYTTCYQNKEDVHTILLIGKNKPHNSAKATRPNPINTKAP